MPLHKISLPNCIAFPFSKEKRDILMPMLDPKLRLARLGDENHDSNRGHQPPDVFFSLEDPFISFILLYIRFFPETNDGPYPKFIEKPSTNQKNAVLFPCLQCFSSIIFV